MMPTLQTDEWKNAYREQAATASRRGREYGLWLVEQCGADALCSADIEEIVADALGDIWIGQVSWDHRAVGLTRAVQDVVRYRVRNLLERVRAHVPLGADGELDASDDADVTRALGLRDDDRVTDCLSTEDLRNVMERRDLARRAVGELQARIKEPMVALLLDSLIASMDGAGLPSRAQLAARLHITVDDVRLLERRLATCAADLPARLCLDGRPRRSVPTTSRSRSAASTDRTSSRKDRERAQPAPASGGGVARQV